MSVRDEAQDQPARFDPSVREVMRSRALLRDPRFANLWISHGLALTAQNALLFTLLVVVFKITGNSLTTSILVLCFILPSIPMGFIVGVVLDRTRKETVLVVTSLVRALGCILFLLFHGVVWTIYLITIGHATAGLFFNPAVISLIPTLVSRDRLVPANSLYNFTLTAAQLAGIVFLAPTIIKTLGADGMFIIAAVMFLSSAWLASRLHTVEEGPEPRLPQGPIFGGLPGIAVCLVLLALVEPLAQLTEQAPGTDWLARQLRFSLLQGLTMLIAGPMGFCYALLNAPAQTVLHERAPPEMRGRIFATQVVSANFISLLPLLVIGAATDLVKVPAVLIMIAAVVAGVAFLSAKVTEREEQEAEARPPRRPSSERQDVGASGRFSEAEPGREHGTGEH